MSSLDEVGLQQGAELDRESSPDPDSKVVRNGPPPLHAPTWKRNLGEMGVEGRESPAVSAASSPSGCSCVTLVPPFPPPPPKANP